MFDSVPCALFRTQIISTLWMLSDIWDIMGLFWVPFGINKFLKFSFWSKKSLVAKILLSSTSITSHESGALFAPRFWGRGYLLLQTSNETPPGGTHPPDKKEEFFQKQALAACNNCHPGIAAPPKAWLRWVISDCGLEGKVQFTDYMKSNFLWVPSALPRLEY